MGKEVGKITRIKDGWMTIQIRSSENCSACASKSACFFAGPSSNYRYIKIHSVPGYKEGNTISLDYRESSKILAAVVVFLIPIVLLLAGYFVGNSLIKGSGGGILGAVSGFLASIGVIYLLNRILARSRLFLPRVSGRVSSSNFSNSLLSH